MSNQNGTTPVEVYSGSAWEAEFVKTLLENEEIKAFIKNSNLGTIAPFQTAPGGAGSVSVIILSSDFERARKIVEDYENSGSKDANE